MLPHAFTTESLLRTRWQTIARFSIYLLAFFLFFLALWIRKYFGSPTFDQILYHLRFGSEGLVSADRTLMYRFFKWCVALPLMCSILAMQVEKAARARHFSVDGWLRSLGEKFAGCSHVARVLKTPLILLIAAALYLSHQVSVFAYVNSQAGPDYFAAHYVPPDTVQLKAGKPKNLVLIYMESVEATYGDKSRFGADLLAGLHRLDGVRFERYAQAPGTGWTIAAIVATQCGVPLKTVTMYDGNEQGENLQSFLPGAVCLGDLLDQLGYRNVFMGGASLSFAGKRRFLQDHHYHEIFGKEEWLERGVDLEGMNGWGLYDDELFARAGTKLRELHAAGRPFNLTLLTVDTHHPEGHLSKTCDRRGLRDFEGIVQCSADQVAEFVGFIRDSGYLADTNVVIVGDHLAMANTVSDKLNAGPRRLVFNSFVSAQPPQKNREEILHFDLFPTMLEFMNIEVAGNRLGLGYSAFHKADEQTAPQRLAEMESALLNRSDAYLRLWRNGE